MEIEVWAEREPGGWIVGITNHTERFVSFVRKGLSERAAQEYRARLLVLALDLAEEPAA